MRLVPFKQTFPLDQTLADTLKSEAQGILAWAIQGCLEWRRDGLQPPASVLTATKTYQKESDPLAEFLASRCKQGPGGEIRAGAAYELYTRWADDQGFRKDDRLTGTKFGRVMGDRFDHKSDSSGKRYLGVGERRLVGLDQ